MKNTSLQMPSLKKAVLLAGVALFAFSAPAFAGFEWKGPLEAPHAAAPAPDAMTAAPETDMAPISANNPPPMSPMVPPPMHTVPHGDTSFKPAQPPATPIVQNASNQAAQDLAPVEMTPAPEAAAPVAATPVTAAPVVETAAAPQGEVLSGFGKDVPLVIALQQVVPAGYQYSFGAGVNPGVSVSWEGGKPWQQVLSDMLATQGLGYKIQNNAVVIGNFPSDVPAQTGAAAPMTPAPQAAPAQDDMAPVSITSAPMTPAPAAAPAPAEAPAAAPAAAPAKDDGVTIHREKKKSLLERLGWKKSESENSDSAEAHESMTKAEARAAKDNIDSAPAKPADAIVSPSTSTAYSAPETGRVTASNTASGNGDAFSGAHDSALTAPPAGATPTASDNQPERLAAAPAAEAAPATDAPAAVTGEWTGQKGQTLREVLKSWSDKAGVDLYWSIDYDYRLSDNASFNGDYDQAVAGLLDRFSTVRPQPYGQLHKSAGGPRVLVVKSYDLSK